MRKLLSLILVIILIFNMGTTVFAYSNLSSDSDFSVSKLSENSFLMSKGDNTGILTIKETTKGTTLTVKNNASGEDEGYFYINKIEGTIYSSYTGNTICISEINSDNEIMPLAVGDVVSRTTHKISYAALSDMVTPTSTDISIASAMITIVAAIQGVTIVTVAAIVVALLSTPLWDVIRAGLLSKDTKHGIQVVVAKVEIQKHQGGGIVKGYKYEIESVSTY